MLKQCCDTLEEKKLTVAFIESASSGYLCSQFSIYKNSGADILLGGLVSYDPSIKRDILKISPKLIEQFTAESQEVTEAMAKQGKFIFSHANFIVACTGLLKPGGSATVDKPEGTFYLSIYYNHQFFNYSYLISGTPLERLNTLTQYVAENILTLLSAG